MAFQPLTYAGQYPPLTPRSASDVASFERLHASLRSIPELAKEGDKILNEEMLSRLVDGVSRFQRDHLGRKNKSKYWPALRLPSTLLSDRSSDGPLSTAILSAFRIKKTSPWRNFNFDNPKLFDDNISIIKSIESDLRNRGLLKRPVIYFDATVEEGLGKGEVARLTKIAQRFGASVADAYPSSKVTHVVAYDPEEHDAKEVIDEEERREKAGEEIERTYLKTLVVVDVPLVDGGGEGAARTKKMALAHWWYHPSSYDEWMAAADVSGEVEQPFHPGIPGGPAVVGCKFVRDVEKFNEWGVEADYAVMEFERKLACLRKQPNKSASSSKRSSKRSRSASAKNDSSTSEHVGDSSLPTKESSVKRKKLNKEDDSVGTNNASLTVEKIASPAASPNKSGKSKSSKPSTSSNNIQATSRHTSERRRPEGRTGGMNPRRIITGIRDGPRNEYIRRIVYDGALRVEEAPYMLVKDALADFLLGSGADAPKHGVGAMDKIIPPLLGARHEWRKFLPPNGFIRPSLDPSLGRTMLVTELTKKTAPSPSPSKEDAEDSAEDAGACSTATTAAVQRSVPILELPSSDDEGSGGEALSIRGGGNGGIEEEDQASVFDTSASVNAQPPREDSVNVTDPPTEGGNGNVADVAITDSGPPNEAMKEVAKVESAVKSKNVGTDAAAPGEDAPVEPKKCAPAESKEDNDMQVDNTATVENPTDPEGDVKVTEVPSVKPCDEGGVTVGDGVAEARSPGPQPKTTVVSSSSAAVPETKPMEVEAPVSAVVEGNTEKAPEVTTSQAPTANVGVDNAGTLLEQPTPEVVQKTESQAQSVGKQLPPAPMVATPTGTEVSQTKNPTPAATIDHKREAQASAGKQLPPAPMVVTTTGTVVSQTKKPTPAATTDHKKEAQASAGKQLPPAPMVATTTGSEVSQTTAVTTANAQAPSTVQSTTETAKVTSCTVESTENAAKEQQPSAATTAASCQVVPLPSGNHLSSSLYRPTSAATEEDTANFFVAPSWYDRSGVSDLERRSLPEWFNGTAPHRTSATFVKTREKMLELAKGAVGQSYVTSTAIRRCVTGDAGSLLRMFNFLVGWGMLNGGSVGETAPSDVALRGLRRAPPKRKHSRIFPNFWSTSRMNALESSVVRQFSKKQAQQIASNSKMDIDWDAIAAEVGDGVSAAECQRAFVEPPGEEAKLIADSGCGNNKSTFSQLLGGVRPDVIKSTIEAALTSTSNVAEARKASFAATLASAAVAQGVAAEAEVECTLMDIVDQRVQRLENRAALLDDVEALLEAERVSLELERRDMYTARCRHWFGDGSS